MKVAAEKGFSLIETLVAAAVAGLVLFATVRLIVPVVSGIQRIQVRQQVDMQARICMETITQALSKGRVSTLQISTPPTTPAVGRSRIQFQTLDGSAYVITWSTSPMNSVHLQKTPSGGGVTTDRVLATRVVGLHFNTPNLQDPALISMTLRMVVPLNESGRPDSLYTLLVPNQTVLMDPS